MLPPATPIEEKFADLGLSPFRLGEKGRYHTSVDARRCAILRLLGGEVGQNALLPCCKAGPAESSVAVPVGDRTGGPREEGSGRAPNPAIPAATLVHYIRCGESHRSACCYPYLYARA